MSRTGLIFLVLGNFMLLCEFDPGEVYRWFMELFIDAYD
jgi:deoxyribodipyrimidine photolyase-related protein